MSAQRQDAERVRAAELISALCLASDLGMGFPFGHGLQTALIALRLADRLGVDETTAQQTLYAALLFHVGCTTDAHVAAQVFGGSLTEHLGPRIYGPRRQVVSGVLRALPDPDSPALIRPVQIAQRIPRMARAQRPALQATCEVAQMLAKSMGLPASMNRLFAYLTDRWDGHGPLGRAVREQIPMPIRIVHVADDANLQQLIGGQQYAVGTIRAHAGHGLDPQVAACLVDDPATLSGADDPLPWALVLASEPATPITLGGAAIDRALAAMGGFADLISPYLSGHCSGVAALASAAAQRCGLGEGEVTAIGRAALVHDLGRVAVAARSWQRPGPLSAAEWEQVRLHPYRSERILAQSPFLASLAPIARAHHERLDGSGYHRGCRGLELSAPARLLAAADAYHTWIEPRPHRPALDQTRAGERLAQEANARRLDPVGVGAVLEAADQPVPHLERPAGLTAREAEVVAMLARGLQTKQVARAIGISVKTADRHVQNAYTKIGVSSRAAAALFAMEHGLTAWGEFPIVAAKSRW